MRPIFLMPWWLYVLGGGGRWSLRRLLRRTAGLALIAAVVGAGAAFAFHGTWRAQGVVVPLALAGAAAGALWTLLGPAFAVARESLAAGALRTAALRDVSFGLLAAYAAAAACGAYVLAPHVPALAAMLAQARAANGAAGGDARFLVGGTLVAYPLALVGRELAVWAGRPRSQPYGSPRPRAADPRMFERSRLRQTLIPPGGRATPAPHLPPQPAPRPAPARIVDVTITPGPSEPRGPRDSR